MGGHGVSDLLGDDPHAPCCLITCDIIGYIPIVVQEPNMAMRETDSKLKTHHGVDCYRFSLGAQGIVSKRSGASA